VTSTYSSFAETSLGGSLGSSHRPGTAIEPGLVARGIIDVVPGSVFSAVWAKALMHGTPPAIWIEWAGLWPTALSRKRMRLCVAFSSRQ
jgi:hypothetical protein